MRSFVIALVLMLISALSPSSARAQARCGDPDPEISISVCSAIIQSGRARGRDLAVAHTERGVAYVTLLDYDRALLDFGEAIRIDPTFARAFANRGAVHGAKQDFDKAIDDFTRVLELEPRSATRLRRSRGHAPPQRAARRGDSRLHRGDSPQPGVRRGDSEPRHHAGRHVAMCGGDCRFHARHRAFESNRNQEPGSHRLVDRGVCYEKGGRDDLALKDYSAHLELDPRSQYGLELRGALLLPRAAIRSRPRRLRAGARRQPSSPTALYGRGMVKRTTGDARGGDAGHGDGEGHAQPAWPSRWPSAE